MQITHKGLALLAKYALSVCLLGLLFYQVDLEALWIAAKDISPTMLGLALLLEVMQIAIVAYRWKFVVQSIGSELSYPRSLELLSIGMFLGQVLPGAVGGDVVRVWKTRQAGLSMSASINSVLLERIAALLGLALLLTLTAPLLLSKYFKFTIEIWVFPLILTAGIGGIGALMLLDRLPGIFDRWMGSHHLSSLARDTRILFLHPQRILWLMLLVIAGHVNLCVQVWVLALGLGVPLTLLDSLILIPIVILLAYLPISLAGWGVREVAMVSALGFAGVSNAQSLVISILFGMVGLVISLPGLVFWMRAKKEIQV